MLHPQFMLRNAVGSRCVQMGMRLIALAGIVFCMNACQAALDRDLSNVRFRARSGGDQTKTGYGDIIGGYKVIAWETGDKIRIYSPDSAPVTSSDTPALSDYIQSDYHLTGITAEGRYSKAGLNPVGEHGLMWEDGGGKADFYAVYPYDNAVSVPGSAIAAEVIIPALQDGGNDISGLPLVAAAKNVANGGDVNLEFIPVFTTFEFTIKSDTGSGELTLNSITLSTKDDPSNTAYVAGTGYYPIGGGAFEYGSTKSRSATISFNPKPVITESSATTFTLFALPVDLTDMTLTVNWTKDHVTIEKSLKLNQNGSPLSFGAGRFIQITGVAVPDRGIRFFLSDVAVDDFDNKSHTVSF